MDNPQQTKVFIGKMNKYVFFAEKVNARKTFAFTSSNYIIDYNIRLLQSSQSKAVHDIDFTAPNKVHFLNFGKYIIVMRHTTNDTDKEMYFIDYKLKKSSITMMNEIFSKRELEVILELRQKMIDTYEGSDGTIASIASIYN